MKSTESTAFPSAGSTPLQYCRDCEYPLCGLDQNRCPECGLPFDPLDPKTFVANRRRERLHRQAQAVGTAAFGLGLVAAVVEILWSVVAWDTIFIVLLMGAAMIGGLISLAVSAVSYLGAWRWPEPRRVIKMLVLWMLVVSVPFTQWPMVTSFALHAGAFDRLADDLEADRLDASAFPRWVGIYRVKGMEMRGAMPCFWVDANPGGPSGFVRGYRGRGFNLWGWPVRLNSDWHFIEED